MPSDGSKPCPVFSLFYLCFLLFYSQKSTKQVTYLIRGCCPRCLCQPLDNCRNAFDTFENEYMASEKMLRM